MFDIANIEPEAKRESVKLINFKNDQNKFNDYDLENILDRLANNPTVIGYVLTRLSDGTLIKTNIDTVALIENISVNLLIENMLKLVDASKRAIKELNPIDDMDYLRVNTRKYEIMLSKVDNYVLIVVQLNKQRSQLARASPMANC